MTEKRLGRIELWNNQLCNEAEVLEANEDNIAFEVEENIFLQVEAPTKDQRSKKF